jgi:hypothetical protein
VRRASLALLVLGILVAVPAASADGDPASDTLILRNVFLPYPAPSTANGNELSRRVAIAYGRGYRIKVAVIANETDLGSVPSLFGKPADYAKFLGQELATYFVGPLLVVMPDGYGIYDGGRSTKAERRVLAGGRPSGSSADDLTTSASAIVQRLVDAKALVSKDIRPPYASTFNATVTAGRSAQLRYAVFDDSGRTSERLAVRDPANHVLAHWSVKLRQTNATKTYTVAWDVPKNVPKTGLRFCLTAYDPTGNHSPTPSCAPVTVK